MRAQECDMSESDFLAKLFEGHRAHLKSVALRMLGSRSEAEDAVQEAFLRLMRADVSDVANLRGWLTTVVARVCLDVLRVRKVRQEAPIGRDAEAVPAEESIARDAAIADAVGVGMLVVLETLTPAERVAFVLHDMFDMPFEDIASIIRRSPMAARQLASRARRRVQSARTDFDPERERQREVVSAFLAASRGGDFSALLALLAPEAVLRADPAAVEASLARADAGAPLLASEIRGREAIAETFKGRARAARRALIEGEAGLVFAPGGKPMVVFDFVVEHGRIVEISLIADASYIAALHLEM
jgi:RNA polymerase sigma factor (sigma-70 family)